MAQWAWVFVLVFLDTATSQASEIKERVGDRGKEHDAKKAEIAKLAKYHLLHAAEEGVVLLNLLGALIELLDPLAGQARAASDKVRWQLANGRSGAPEERLECDQFENVKECWWNSVFACIFGANEARGAVAVKRGRVAFCSSQSDRCDKGAQI